MTNYSVYLGDKDCGFIIADSLPEAESRARDLYPSEDRDSITVSFLNLDSGLDEYGEF